MNANLGIKVSFFFFFFYIRPLTWNIEMPKWVSEVRQFFSVDFLRFNCLNTIWPHFLGVILHVHTIWYMYPPNTLNAKCLGKKPSILAWDLMSRWKHNYCNFKKHKRNRLFFRRVISNFVSLMNTKINIFTRVQATYENTAFDRLRWNNINSHTKNKQISSMCWLLVLKWAAARQNQQNDLCVQRRLRSAWASA